MTLGTTCEMMSSTDYKDRFLAEYYQLKIRLGKLNEMLQKWNMGTLDFRPTCPPEVYKIQSKAMSDYLDILVIRAKIEGIEIIKT